MMLSFSKVDSQNSIQNNDPNNIQNKKVLHFVKSAVREFRLDLNQYKDLLKARRTYVDDFMSTVEELKKSQMSQDQKKAKLRALDSDFNKLTTRIMEKSMLEQKAFRARIRKELKKIK